MERQLYCIKDEHVGIFDKPFIAVNDADATRSFGRACQDKDIQLGMFPDHYSLYNLGSMDDDTAVIQSKVRFVVSGSSFKKIQESEAKK